MPVALFALAIGAFGIGLTEFVIAGILPQIARDFGVDIPAAGLMATTYALGVFVGAPILTILGAKVPRKTMLIGLALIFTLGNAMTALAPSLPIALAGRVLTAFNHGTFFGIGSIIAIVLGAAAAAGVLYAAWQALRTDDELWVADDPLSAPDA